MAEVSAKDVAALRKVTGAGMMDCKKALRRTTATRKRRSTGSASRACGASKRAGRSAEQGTVDVVLEDNVAALVELTCETDFVAKGADFVATVAALAQLVAEQGDEDLASQPFEGQTVGEAVDAARRQARREDRARSRRPLRDHRRRCSTATSTSRTSAGTIGVLVELGGVDRSDPKAKELAHDLALHIASAAPRFIRREDVPDDAIEKEREVLTELTRNEGKPESAIDKIVEGRLNGFYKDYVLLEQGFVRDPKVTVGKLIEGLGADAEVRRFTRVKVGEE